jgi:hypothetical protein
MKCKHEEIFVKLEIVRWFEGSTDGQLVDVHLNLPVQVKATTTCPECGFSSMYNAYGPEWIEAKGYGAHQYGSGFPLWLKRHMRLLAATAPIIAEALRACGVLAMDEGITAL